MEKFINIVFGTIAVTVVATVAMSTMARAETATEMSCKKLYTMQDLKSSASFKEELNKRCDASVLQQLTDLRRAYDTATDTAERKDIIAQIISLENKLEVK